MAVKLHPQMGGAYFNLGLVLHGQGKLEEAAGGEFKSRMVGSSTVLKLIAWTHDLYIRLALECYVVLLSRLLSLR